MVDKRLRFKPEGQHIDESMTWDFFYTMMLLAINQWANLR
jgi:hypothetical protein